MNKPRTTQKIAPSPQVERVTEEEAQELHQAGAALNTCAQAAEKAVAAHQDARAVLAHVSRRLAAKYRLGSKDSVQPDGVIVRAPTGGV